MNFMDILSGNDRNKCTVYIYKMVSEINNGGSFSMDKKEFQNKLQYFTEKYNAGQSDIHEIYQYNDMCLIKNNNGLSYQTSSMVDFQMDNGLCVMVKKNKPIYYEEFPVLDQYHNHSSRKVKTFYCSPVTVNFIEEDNDLCYIEISFTNYTDKVEWLVSKLEKVLGELDFQ